eukprot:g5339.t1
MDGSLLFLQERAEWQEERSRLREEVELLKSRVAKLGGEANQVEKRDAETQTEEPEKESTTSQPAEADGLHGVLAGMLRLGPGGGTDPVNNVSPELSAAGRKYAQRYEDIMLAGRKLWTTMLKRDDVPKKIYFIGTNGNSGKLIAEALMDSLAYVPAPDGTMFLRRKPGVEYPKLVYFFVNSDEALARESDISSVDLYMEDEKRYREIETEVLKKFSEEDTGTMPAGCVVGESAVDTPENLEILKKGLVIWVDVSAETSWSRTQIRPKAGGGLYVRFEKVRPPVWCIASGWDGDIDDGEAKAEYVEKVNEYRDKYEAIADLRIRSDVPGIQENQYWGAERLLKAIAEFYGIDNEDASVEEEMLEADLEKFLEGARLSKYLQPALDWCDEQGAASIDDVVENADDFADALSLKPLERKRLAKAAEAVAAGLGSLAEFEEPSAQQLLPQAQLQRTAQAVLGASTTLLEKTAGLSSLAQAGYQAGPSPTKLFTWLLSLLSLLLPSLETWLRQRQQSEDRSRIQ